MSKKQEKRRLTPSEAAYVLRRASELGARRRRETGGKQISADALADLAEAADISGRDVRRAVSDLHSEKAAETSPLARKLYGDALLRVVREVGHPPQATHEHLERMLRVEQGLKPRGATEDGSLWDAGDLLGVVRRTLDFSGDRALLKARSVELRVYEREGEEAGSGANLTADVSNQRGEHISLAGLVGATLAVPLAIAGFYEPLYFLGVLPALAVPGVGFRLAYGRSCAEVRRSLDRLLDAAEEGPTETEDEGSQPEEDLDEEYERRPGQVRDLKPVRRFPSGSQKRDQHRPGPADGR